MAILYMIALLLILMISAMITFKNWAKREQKYDVFMIKNNELTVLSGIPVRYCLNDIERVEIINGGGTVLYGSGTRGGVVNIITKNRTKEGASGKAYYQNSSYGTNKLGFDAGINFNNKFIIDLGYENTNGKGYR